ncbi:hypothetical protein E4U38_005585 [Claviceps purpurea]|nr:hypothetical protein E4U38_005585 [Claviceps purpurea]
MGSSERREIIPVKTRVPWTAEDDNLLLQLRWADKPPTWEEIADHFPERTQGSCRKRYERILNNTWDEKGRDRLAALYESHKEKMWQIIAQGMNVPWTEAEQHHWLLGKEEMQKRAADPDFRETWQKDYVASETDDDSNLVPPSVDDAVVSADQEQGRIKSGRWSRWSGGEVNSLFNHKAAGKTWDEISILVPGRSAEKCKSHYHLVRGRAHEWRPELQTDLSRLYQIHKSEMWAEFEEQLGVPWQLAEEMHWRLGLNGIKELAGLPLTVEPDQPATNPHELQPPSLTDCEPFDNCWATLILNRDP